MVDVFSRYIMVNDRVIIVFSGIIPVLSVIRITPQIFFLWIFLIKAYWKSWFLGRQYSEIINSAKEHASWAFLECFVDSVYGNIPRLSIVWKIVSFRGGFLDKSMLKFRSFGCCFYGDIPRLSIAQKGTPHKGFSGSLCNLWRIFRYYQYKKMLILVDRFLW